MLRDNDTAGDKHAEAVIRSCGAAGLEVQAPRLPGLPPVRDKHGEDVSDWLAAGHSAEELRAVVEAAPVVTAAPAPPETPSRSCITVVISCGCPTEKAT